MPRCGSEGPEEGAELAYTDYILVPFEVSSVGLHEIPKEFAFVLRKILGVGVDTVAARAMCAFGTMPVVVLADAKTSAGALGIEVLGELETICGGVRADDEAGFSVRTKAVEVGVVGLDALGGLRFGGGLGLPLTPSRCLGVRLCSIWRLGGYDPSSPWWPFQRRNSKGVM